MGVEMPWFPEFTNAVELARTRQGAGQADPVAQYLAALNKGDTHALETVWPGEVVIYDPSGPGPLAVTRSRESGMDEGQAQLVRNGILLLAVLAPAAAGLWAISEPLVKLVVAEPFRDVTAAVLPWAILAGAARNFRIHFGEQVFLLREETRIPLANDIIDGLTTIGGGAIGLAWGGLPGSVAGAAVGSILSLLVTLACGSYWHAFSLPPGHLLRILGATAVMVGVLKYVPVAANVLSLSFAIGVGAAVYGAVLLLVYPGAFGEVRSRLKRLSA